jgi:hypothetical protein
MNIISAVVELDKPIDRKVNWINYYLPLRHRLNAGYFVLSSDQDGDFAQLNFPNREVSILDYERRGWFRGLRDDCVNVICFKDKLPPRPEGKSNSYPRHWRSLLACFELAKAVNAENLLTLESDSWVLSDRLADRLYNWSHGIGCPWCPVHNMPELMLAAYNKDSYEAVMKLIKSKSWEQWAEPQPENLERLFGHTFKLEIWQDMIGDRYVEYQDIGPQGKPIPEDADFCIQGDHITPRFKGAL